MITGINESKTLTKHISCECKWKFDERKCNPDHWWNSDKCWCECKNPHACEKDYVLNPALCNCENVKYLASIVDDWAIISDEIIDAEAEARLNDQINFNENKATCKT